MEKYNELKVSKVPVRYMADDVREYVQTGVLHGNFLNAIFSSNLVGAFRYADTLNARSMGDWADFIYNHTPAECWGSVEKIKQWKAHNGLNRTD